MVNRLIRLKYFLLLLVLIPYLFGFTTHTSFEIENTLTVEETNDVLARLNFQKLNFSFSGEKIYAYDVNQDGEVVLVIRENGRRSAVIAYDKEGTFLFGASFDANGSYAVEWASNGANLISHRSDCIFAFDRQGNCQSIADYPYNDTNRKYDQYLLSKEKTAEEYSFRLENERLLKKGAFYVPQQLVRIDGNGAETVVYKTNKTFFTSELCFMLMFFTVFVIIFVCFVKKLRKQNIKGTIN